MFVLIDPLRIKNSVDRMFLVTHRFYDEWSSTLYANDADVANIEEAAQSSRRSFARRNRREIFRSEVRIRHFLQPLKSLLLKPGQIWLCSELVKVLLFLLFPFCCLSTRCFAEPRFIRNEFARWFRPD